MPLELVVENYFVKRVEALGGTTIKLLKLGWPDRLAILPGGRIIFAEIKRPRNGRVSAVQRVVLGTLAGLGGWCARSL